MSHKMSEEVKQRLRAAAKEKKDSKPSLARITPEQILMACDYAEANLVTLNVWRERRTWYGNPVSLLRWPAALVEALRSRLPHAWTVYSSVRLNGRGDRERYNKIGPLFNCYAIHTILDFLRVDTSSRNHGLQGFTSRVSSRWIFATQAEAQAKLNEIGP